MEIKNKFLFFFFMFVCERGFAQSAISTYQDLLTATDEIQYLRTWEKLSSSEQNKIQRLYFFKKVDPKDFDFQKIVDQVESGLKQEGAGQETVYEMVLSPENQKMWIMVSRSDCLAARLSIGNRAWAQSSEAGKSLRSRSWTDEVKEFVCAQDWEVFRNTICAPVEKVDRTEKPVVPVAPREPEKSKECIRTWSIGVSFVGPKDKPERIWTSQTLSENDLGVEWAKIRERFDRKVLFYRIKRDQKNSELKDADYFAVIENPPSEKFRKLSLFLFSEGVSSRDIENPCLKLDKFFLRHKETPSQTYVDRCGQNAKSASKVIQFKLTPKYSPEKNSSYESVVGYHSELVKVVNYVFSVVAQYPGSGAVLSMENADVARIDAIIERGLFSQLLSKISQAVLGQKSDADVDVEAEIAKAVIAFLSEKDEAQLSKEKEAITEIKWLLEILDKMILTGQSPNRGRAVMLVQKQKDLTDKVVREVLRREKK